MNFSTCFKFVPWILFCWLLQLTGLMAEVSKYQGKYLGFSATAVNSLGQVAGYRGTESGKIHAVLYSGGKITDLGTLPGGDHSEATGINSSGKVVGTSNIGNGLTHGFIWSAGHMTDLGTLPGGAECYPTAVNDAGQVTGYSDTLQPGTSYPQPDHAFIWSAGSMVDIGNISSFFGNFSVGNAINSSGEVVGWSINDDFETHAFRYSGGVMHDLGTLGGSESRANGINDEGTVVGWSYTSGDLSSHAFVDAGSMTDLGTLSGFTGSSARAINKNGKIVGNSAYSGTPAFIYSGQTGMVKLDTRVLGPSWTLNGATAISSAGHIIATGSNAKQYGTSFLLTPADSGPNIEVSQPAIRSLVDGRSQENFGTVALGGKGKSITFTVGSIGTGELRNLALSISGTANKDFTFTRLKATTLGPGRDATFKVTFAPKAKGTRKAVLKVISNDPNESPFSIKLLGSGKG